MKYIENPNFPKERVAVAAVSAEAKDVIAALNSAKIAAVPVDPCSNLPYGIASHADLQLLHLGGNKLMTASCSKECTNMLKIMGFESTETETDLNSDYPYDCLINVSIIGNKIIMNPKAADQTLIDYINDHNMEMVSVNQGYSKCSILSACDDAIITADRGVAKNAESHGIEVLLIEGGNIYL